VTEIAIAERDREKKLDPVKKRDLLRFNSPLNCPSFAHETSREKRPDRANFLWINKAVVQECASPCLYAAL
jgi:hypothetical protein